MFYVKVGSGVERFDLRRSEHDQLGDADAGFLQCF